MKPFQAPEAVRSRSHQQSRDLIKIMVVVEMSLICINKT